MNLEIDKDDKLLWVIPKTVHKFENIVLFREDPEQPVCVPIYDKLSDSIIFTPLIKTVGYKSKEGEYKILSYQFDKDDGYPESTTFNIYNHDGYFYPLIRLDYKEWVRLQENPHRTILSYTILCWIPYTDLLFDLSNQHNISEGYKKLICSDIVRIPNYLKPGN